MVIGTSTNPSLITFFICELAGAEPLAISGPLFVELGILRGSQTDHHQRDGSFHIV